MSGKIRILWFEFIRPAAILLALHVIATVHMRQAKHRPEASRYSPRFAKATPRRKRPRLRFSPSPLTRP
jgi:hypothetical protein